VLNFFKRKNKSSDAIIDSNNTLETKEENKSDNSINNIGWYDRLKQGLARTKNNFGKKLLGVFGGGKIDSNLYEELEDILLSSDVGVNATEYLLNKVQEEVTIKGLKDAIELKQVLKNNMYHLVKNIEEPLVISQTPHVIMFVGINGAGKTTSIGKIAKYFQDMGKTVMLGAGDTFRAAACEQLIEWGNRNNVTVISQKNGDSAAVCYDAVKSAIANKVDVLLLDTAGRLPTQLNLMEEIKKVKRVITKSLSRQPDEVILVLDANIGQNGLNQVKAFHDALNINGLVMTKLDGTAKGGIVCAIAKDCPIKLRFIGVGEKIDDLRPFSANDYIDILFD
jgi:fused signal recognition particle receptor